MHIVDRFRVWRLRPGIMFAAKLAEQTAWQHQNASMLGPEANLLKLSLSLQGRLLSAEEGKPDGLHLDPVTRLPKGWKTVESER